VSQLSGIYLCEKESLNAQRKRAVRVGILCLSQELVAGRPADWQTGWGWRPGKETRRREDGVATAKQRFRRVFLCSESRAEETRPSFGFVYANKVRDKLLFCLNFVAAWSLGLLQLPLLLFQHYNFSSLSHNSSLFVRAL